MLEKLVLMVVGFFSIATEMRLMCGDDNKETNINFKESEVWHA
jgi:hypothetical protein